MEMDGKIYIHKRETGGSPFSLIWRRKPSLIKHQAVLDFWVNLPIFCHLWCLLYLCFSSKNIIIMTKMTGIVMMMVIKMSLAWGQDLKVERTELFDQFNLKSHLFDCLQYSISTYSTSRTWSYQPGSTENWSLILFLVTIYWMAFKVPLFYF